MGPEYERMGKAVNTFAVLTYTLPGMPLIYSGQEAALKDRLAFFEKDTINWGTYELADFYAKLGHLRKENQALWSGEAGGSFKRLKTSDNASIYAFMRKGDAAAVVVITNLSNKPLEFSIKMKEDGKLKTGIDWATGEEFTLKSNMSLPAWGYKILLLESR